MEVNYFKHYKPTLIIPFILVVGTLIGFLAEFLIGLVLNTTSINYFQYPSTTILIGGLIFWIDKNLWKYWPFKWLFWIKNIYGRYEGYIEYEHFKTGQIERKPCAMEIEQTASKITINTYFDFEYSNQSEKTFSKSLITSIIKDDFDNLSLVFTYHNSGNILSNIPPHNGTNVLKIKNDDGLGYIEGIYFTDRVPQTKGEINVKFKSKKIIKKF